MSSNIFESASDTLNLKSQMNDCSMGNLNIVEGDLSNENEAAPGVLDVTIDISLEGRCYNECGWAGYAYVNSWNSVYQGNFYKNVGEIGHNFGLGHSGLFDGQTYSDHTGYMGNPSTSNETGRLCFNAAKSWQLGCDQVTPVLLKIETNTGADHFVAFNQATGVNDQVTQARDLVTISRVNQNNGTSLSQSYVDGFIDAGGFLNISNFGGTNIDLDIEVLNIDLNSNPAKARVSVKYGDVTISLQAPLLYPLSP